jgi:microcystin-dependent protein
MTDYDKTKPLGSEAANLLDDRTRANFVALEERLSKEHQFPDNPLGVRSGKHKFGVGNTVARDAAFPVPYAGAFWGYNTDVASPQIHTGSAWFSLSPPTTLLVGEIKIWSSNGALPAGWFRCDGAELSTTTYSALYAACGGVANWFGTPSIGGVFKIPDLRQRVPVGYTALAVDYDTPGKSNATGAYLKSLTLANLPAHNHAGSTVGAVIAGTPVSLDQGVTGNSGNRIGGGNNNPGAAVLNMTALPHTHAISIFPEGGPGTPVDIRDAYLVLGFIIWSGVP